jgi:ERCC4-type nuclease
LIAAPPRRCHRRPNDGLPHRLVVDHSEGDAPLLRLVRESGLFLVRMDRLPTGDYLIDDRILIERKTHTDFVASLIDGRLFPEVVRLAKSHYRALVLIEGPERANAPDVHLHSVEGALVSIAAMWRVPVLHSSDTNESYRLLRFLADQWNRPEEDEAWAHLQSGRWYSSDSPSPTCRVPSDGRPSCSPMLAGAIASSVR